MSRLDKARALVTEVRAVLDAADLEQVMADVDAARVPSGSRHGIVIVSPPELDFEGYFEAALTWELHVIAGPSGDYLAAWDRIDQIITALEASPLPLKSAKPGSWQGLDRGQPPIPAYTITLHPTD